MRATRAAGVGVRGHGPLLRGNACIDTTNDRTIRASRQSRSGTSLFLGVGARHARDMRGRRGCSRAWPAPTGERMHRDGTARHGTANNRAIRDVGLHRERAFIREIAGSDFTDAGSRRTGMCGGVSERGGPASRSADAAIVRRSKARMLQSRSNPKRGCCNLEATRPEAQGRKS